VNECAVKDIEVRASIAKKAFGKLKPILTGGLRQEMRKKLVKSLNRSLVTYASELYGKLI